MENAALQELGKDLVNKNFHHQMHNQLLSLVNENNVAKLEIAKAEIDALRDENCRLQADKRRLTDERDAIDRKIVCLQAQKSLAYERAEALDAVLGAIIVSLRPYGLDKRRFRGRIAEIGQRTPSMGPEAARHGVLLGAARKILKL